MHKAFLGLMILVILAFSVAAAAQTTGLEAFNECDRAGLSAAITEALADAGTDEDALDTVLGEAGSAIARVRAACSELTFEGTNAKLIGPIEIPEGYYRVRVTTEGFFIAEMQVLEGSCETSSRSMFILSRGEASDGAETLLTSEGCTALVDTSNISTPWTLVFERIG